MKGAIATNGATRDGWTIKPVGLLARPLQHGIDELIHRRAIPNRQFQMGPARHTGINKFERGTAVCVHIDLIAAARPILAWVSPLCIARIDDHGGIGSEHGTRMDMAERPVVESS